MTRCAIYTRISADQEGEALGVARQEEDCRRLAQQRGYTVTEVYSDNDISASTKSTKDRPAYNQMMTDAKRGQFETILAYSNSRLTRRPLELEDFITLFNKHGVSAVTVVSGEDNLATADGRMVARIKASVDAAEAERIGERVARAKQQKAQSGAPLNSRFRTFGYTRDFQPEPDEAKVVKEMFNRIAKGHSIMSVYDWMLTLYPINPVSNKKLTYNAVSQMLRNARYAGYNVYKGEIIGQGTQSALIDVKVWDAVQQRRKGQKRKAGGFNARKYLLTGFIYCKQCYSPMRGHQSSTKKSVSYRCTKDNGGCGKVGMKMQWVDDAVSSSLIDRLGNAALAKHEVPQDNSADIERIENQIEEVQANYRAGNLSMADMLPMLNGLRDDLRTAQALRGQAEAHRQAQRFPAFANIMEWKRADVSQKRALLAQHVKVVVIYPVRVRGQQKTADLHRIEVTWADDVTENLGVVADTMEQQQQQLDELRDQQ